MNEYKTVAKKRRIVNTTRLLLIKLTVFLLLLKHHSHSSHRVQERESCRCYWSHDLITTATRLPAPNYNTTTLLRLSARYRDGVNYGGDLNNKNNNFFFLRPHQMVPITTLTHRLTDRPTGVVLARKNGESSAGAHAASSLDEYKLKGRRAARSEPGRRHMTICQTGRAAEKHAVDSQSNERKAREDTGGGRPLSL